MWRRVGQTVRPMRTQAGLLLDVDGVLVRGGSVLPAARRAVLKLVDRKRQFVLPVVFVTNAGSCQRDRKAKQLSDLLHAQVSPDQVVLSYSPLQNMKSFHDKCVLVCGQGPITDIAHTLGFHRVVSIDQLVEQHPLLDMRLGFHRVVSIDQLVEQHPLLDMVDHNRRPETPPSRVKRLPPIEAIVLFGEPIRWETCLQLLTDVLLSQGRPGLVHTPHLCPQIPVLACNPDLLWMAEAPSPRFGHGVFLLCLEAIYRRLTGRELHYQLLLGKPALTTYQYAHQLLDQQIHNTPVTNIYAIGDNPLTDVVGANLYDRHLTQQEVKPSGAEPVSTRCHSLLVCSGVYRAGSEVTSDGCQAHDLLPDRELLTPQHVVQDVEEAVDLLLLQEGLTPNL